MSLPKFPDYKSDHDDASSIDDAFVSSGSLHLERMGRNYYWLGITIDGVTHHIDIVSKRGQMRARLRK